MKLIFNKITFLTGLFSFLILSVASAQEDSLRNDEQFKLYKQEIPGTPVSFQMAPIPGGKFLMGSPETEPDRKEDEGPQVEVEIEPFYIGVFEVTFDEYEIFREKNLDKAPEGKEDSWNADAVTRPSPPYEDPTFGMGKYGYPAASMTQFAALRYCKWLTEKTGVFYRLATEAEWEYACRAGTTTAYSFGDSVSKLDEYAWHYENSDDAYHKVGEKKPNPWGLYDMHGNVAEWTLDQYKEDFYASLDADEKKKNPWAIPVKLHPRTVKGGSWDDDPDKLRSAARTESSMKWKQRDPQIPKSFWWNTDSPFVGFRIVSPKKQPTPEELKKFWGITLDE
ncbi:formylglycine-generating enzyme family protein [Flexithrix dorotheae]|uniref:formylglycine-generating enzyme family protein n=1 Tax=Flexithrix dorotheae TaxID=70993 RepID=UPI000379A213|nr:formylglycine-generating enzyme family protein [Flexithrix dorotheae]